MRKTPVICSLLMAFSLSAMIAGCEPPKAGTKQQPKEAKSSGGSTTGGGAKVPPSPSKGTVETPKAAQPAPKDGDAPKSPDAPKDGEAPKGDDAPKN
jgi:hypothetical protein